MSTHADMMLHRRPFVKAVADALRNDCGVEPGDRILAAVSGGADSVALVRALVALAARKEWALDVHVAHINHHLRDAADADEAFVAELAASLGLTFHRADVRPGDQAGNLEANARHDRYAALLDIADDIEADAIATAHHADDQLETMLMRLIRGTSVYGLAGILPRRRLTNHHTVIRPMLGVDRAAAVEFLTSIGQTWREDHTNADLSRWRARLRADVLPVLRELRPDAASKAVDAARRLRDAARVLSQTVREVEHEVAGERLDGSALYMFRDEAEFMYEAVLEQVVRRQCMHLGARPEDLTGARIDPILRAITDDLGKKRVFDITGCVQVVVDRDTVWWKRTDQSI